MINKRLIQLLKDSTYYIKETVMWNFLALLTNILFNFMLVYLCGALFRQTLTVKKLLVGVSILVVTVLLRAWMEKQSVKSSYHASVDVKRRLRSEIYQKMMRLGLTYQEYCPTSEVVQVAMEGAEQLEIYFSKYLPQLFTSLIAPLTLFIVYLFIDVQVAIVLLVCVPLIPVSIIVVQKIAKRLLAKYWSVYTGLGDSFLENLQGLTTLKIYQADERRTELMDKEAEHFRKITMKVLIMQLNSISVMDIVAYGASAVGMILAVNHVRLGLLSFEGCLFIILLAAEFFIPLRLLGSFFHIAMNGMAASDKIFKLLDIEEKEIGKQIIDSKPLLQLDNVSFHYDEKRSILKNISLAIPEGSFIGLVGVSGSGKSTLAKLLSGTLEAIDGQILVNGVSMNEISNLSSLITTVTHNNHLFKGTIRYNLNMAKACSDEEMWSVLKQVNLDEFVKVNGGLDFELLEGANNLSGGQRQRLNLARALLRETPIYLFDEATSNIDMESENDILKVIKDLQKKCTVIMISHRLDYAENCDLIYYLEEGVIKEKGTHQELMKNKKTYSHLFNKQKELLAYGGN